MRPVTVVSLVLSWIVILIPRPSDRGPQRLIRCKDSGILQTTSIERRAAGGDRPLSGGCIKMRPPTIGSPEFPCFEAAVLFCFDRIENLN